MVCWIMCAAFQTNAVSIYDLLCFIKTDIKLSSKENLKNNN